MEAKIRLLHIGCGTQPLPEWLSHADEVRVDIDPATKPHFVRDMLDLHDIGTFGCIYSSHCLEHLYPYQVPKALKEWQRVLNPGGALIIIVPDLEDVKPDLQPIMISPMGPLCGLDLYYGAHTELEAHPYMAHHCGFIKSTLEVVLKEAGFENITVERLQNRNLAGSGKAKPIEYWKQMADDICGIVAPKLERQKAICKDCSESITLLPEHGGWIHGNEHYGWVECLVTRKRAEPVEVAA